MMDGDLQDPPEIIIEMISKWDNGADSVSCVRKLRKKESFFQRRRGKETISATAETVGKRLQYSLDRARTAQKEHCGLSTTQIT